MLQQPSAHMSELAMNLTRKFALQRKLTLIAAHDSVLAARVKLTRNANRRRRLAPSRPSIFEYNFPKGVRTC